MKRLLCAVWAMALLVLTAGPVLAQAEPAEEDKPKAKAKKARKEKRDRPKKAKSAIRGEYAIMASEVELTDDQKAKLEALIKEMNDAVRKDMEAAKEKAAELKKAIEDAKKAKNKEAGQEARKKLTELKKSSQAIRADYQKKIRELLTPEQRTKWGGFVLYRRVCGRFAKAKLTDDQKKSVRTQCDAAAKELGDLAVSAATKEDKQKLGAEIKKLYEKITTDVLTNEQREAMKKPREKAKGDKKKDKKKGGAGDVK